MPKALVSINSISDASELIKNLTSVDGVSEAHSSRGIYDAVVTVKAGSLSQVKEIVSKRIRRLDNVKSTLTLTLLEALST